MTGPADRLVPVMDVGGTHATCVLFDPSTRAPLAESRQRRELDSSADREDILGQLLACATALDSPASAVWGVAVPGPFDYGTGVARYHDVGKFDALNGVDLGRVLRDGIPSGPSAVHFLNDANAFGLGECTPAGAAADCDRVVGLTLGTGVGSVFLEHGKVVDDRHDVPPDGRVDLLRIDDRPLEDVVSRRAIVARFAELTGGAQLDVAAIAARARTGEAVARRVLIEAFHALGSALRPWVEAFAADVVVLGGSISASWELVAEPMDEALGGAHLVPARLGEDAALIGAGVFVLSTAEEA